MCGIAGYLGPAHVAPERIEATLASMGRRGPDGQHALTIHPPQGHGVLLHSRLSIIDLAARADQPFCAEECVLVFNGEIYNYLELRRELETLGETFATTSDTEVLLRCYLRWGASCVERFEGMWAFALWDGRSHTLLLSRDRFAEKPLYWMRTADGGFCFASEAKQLRSLSGERLTPNHEHLRRYLVNGYKSLYKTSETFFVGVSELPSGCSATVDADFAPAITRYFDRRTHLRPEMTLAQAVEGFRERLLRAVEIRLRADVPLAFMLSGGVDSSALASIASKCFGYDVHAFSIIDADPRYDERANIEATVSDLGCRSTVIETARTGTFERLRELVAYHDAPLYTISYLVHSYLSQAVADHGYRVAVSGTAADELVTGYYDHFLMHLAAMRGRDDYAEYLRDWQTNTGTWVRNPYLKDPDRFAKDPCFRDHIYLDAEVFAGYLTEPFDEPFSEKDFGLPLLRNRMANELFEEAVPVITHEDDLNSMYYSIENRSPYLDTELFEFAYSIPPEHLIRDGYGKYVLREAVAGILNDTVRLDRQKKGFNASIHSVVDLKDEATRDYLLADGPLFDLVRRDAVAKLMEVDEMPNHLSKFMFNVINTKLFLEMNEAV